MPAPVVLPWIGTEVASGGGLGLGEVLSVGGSLLGGLGGLFGKKKKKQQQPIIVKTPTAFGQQSPENQKELQRQLEEYFINAKYGDFFGRPTRRMTLGDVQGDFTPQALFEMQNYFDEQAAMQPAAAPIAAPQQQQMSQPMQNMVMRQMFGDVSLGQMGKAGNVLDDAAFAALADAINKGEYQMTKNKYGTPTFDGNNPFIVKLLQDSIRRNAERG